MWWSNLCFFHLISMLFDAYVEYALECFGLKTNLFFVHYEYEIIYSSYIFIFGFVDATVL